MAHAALLSNICSWVVQNGEENMNEELQKLYGIDLSEFEALPEENDARAGKCIPIM